MFNKPKLALPNNNTSPYLKLGNDDANHFGKTSQNGYPIYTDSDATNPNTESDWNIHFAIALIILVILVNLTLAMLFGVNKEDNSSTNINNIITSSETQTPPPPSIYKKENKPKGLAQPTAQTPKEQVTINITALEKLEKNQTTTNGSLNKKPVFPPLETTNHKKSNIRRTTAKPENKLNNTQSKLLSMKSRQEILKQLTRTSNNKNIAPNN